MQALLRNSVLIMLMIYTVSCNKNDDTPEPIMKTPVVTVSTLAGSGVEGFEDGSLSAAQFANPIGVAVDANGNVYVADMGNDRIRKISTDGVVSTLAGSGNPDYADGTGTNAHFWHAADVAVDGSGNVFVADTYNNRIRKITPSGVVTTFAGSGTGGFADGSGTTAQFKSPYGIAIDANGNIYVADSHNHRIRKITPAGVVSTLAGSGVAGFMDATGANAQFNNPFGIAVDGNGNVYVGDYGNYRIRKISPGGVVTTLAGSGQGGYLDGAGSSAKFSASFGVDVDVNGNVYVVDMGNSCIRKVASNGVVSTIAGDGSSGNLNGIGVKSQFNNPYGVAVDNNGNLYVADRDNNSIRKITIQ